MPQRSIWKGSFVDAFLLKMKEMKDVLQRRDKRIWSRRSTILPEFVGWPVQIYNGKDFIRRKVSEAMVGHKFGEFALTRKAIKRDVKDNNAKKKQPGKK